MNERVEKLKREKRLIKAWIRDLTAEKQARIHAIERELEGLSMGDRRKGAEGKTDTTD